MQMKEKNNPTDLLWVGEGGHFSAALKSPLSGLVLRDEP